MELIVKHWFGTKYTDPPIVFIYKFLDIWISYMLLCESLTVVFDEFVGKLHILLHKTHHPMLVSLTMTTRLLRPIQLVAHGGSLETTL